jgi:16S rRNA (cytidine1402-2'-O)-methyltransferase
MSVLRSAVLIAAEDTRTSGTILKLAESHASLVSLTEHNVEQRTPALLAAARDGSVALVSDAGTPVVADPGARLIAAAHDAGVPVFAVPGPSALAAAISVSGFAGDDVHFLGFLPRPRGQRIAVLTAAASNAAVLVFFESPNRLGATLSELSTMLGDPAVAVCRELTKLHEEVVLGPASELAQRFATTRGECTLVVDTRSFGKNVTGTEDLAAYMAEMMRAGARRSLAAVEAARRFGVPRSQAYELWGHDEGTART